ncbi:uncharacterized protein V1510DRAFT_413365 [Dipodascopsis tothii]|uniref:uncharacterized protein n=1 Tax=Dipodascopsis tothii TaxID=44089 RepID=UPI0034CD63D8
MEITPASLEFTCVFYDDSDPVSLAMAWLSLVPQAIVVANATLVLSRREAETMMLLLGQVVNEAANTVFKRILKEQRPNRWGPGYGLPSAHSQFMAFYATYIILWMWLKAPHYTRLRRFGRAAFLLSLTAGVTLSRVYLYYHTAKQVLLGTAVGVAMGALWFVAVQIVRLTRLLDVILDTPLFRYFQVRDTAEYRLYLDDEYRRWQLGRWKPYKGRAKAKAE